MTTTINDVRTLDGRLYSSGEAGYAEACAAWNLDAVHRPAYAVTAEGPADVAAAVRLARDAGLGVGVMATGHGSTRPVDGGVLVNTSRMRGVEVDVPARRARVRAGDLWTDVVAAAAPHGLTGLPGSSPHVGVVGFSLGGGFGWLGRRFGLAGHSVARAEVVTAEGVVTADPLENPELFWGIRGGTDNFGIVTSLEIELHPVAEVYGGNLYYPLDRARDVLEVYAGWSEGAPPELTSAATFRAFPPLPAVPAELRGQRFVAIRGAWCGDLGEGARFVERARLALGPAAVDTFAPMPVSALPSISMDPVAPLGAVGRTELVPALSADLVEVLVELAGHESGSPLVMLELRQLGGALTGRADELSPLARTDAAYALNAIGLTSDPTQAQVVRRHLDLLARALEGPCHGGDLPELPRPRRRDSRAGPGGVLRGRLVATGRPQGPLRPRQRLPLQPQHPTLQMKVGTTMNTTLVTGATGHVGSSLVPLLLEAGQHVRVLVRDPGRAAGSWGTDVEIHDLGRSGDAAFDGVDQLFLACGNVPEQVSFEQSAIDAAARAGIGRIVKLSARGATAGSPVAFWHWHALIEAHLAESGVPATVLRPSFLMTNLLEAASAISGQGMLVAPAGDARISMIDPRDVAAAAATALTFDGHQGRTYVLTGPAAPGYGQLAGDLGKVVGHPVSYLDVPPEAAREAMTGAGVPAFVADQVLNVFEALRRGEQAATSTAMKDLTGDVPRTFAEFAREHASAFRGAPVDAFSR